MGSLEVESRGGRQVSVGDLVRVYRNLNRPGFFSILDKKTGRVVGYAKSITLEHARFIVGEKGRQRVIREQVKNVHAFVEGVFLSAGGGIPARSKAGYYNPYITPWFIDELTGAALSRSSLVHCQGSRVYFQESE